LLKGMVIVALLAGKGTMQSEPVPIRGTTIP
jgi:hypothetical protein